MKKIYTIKIEPLTAVHIGAGDTLTPLDYKLADMKLKTGGTKKVYAKFSSDAMLKRLIESNDENALKEFETMSGSGNMKALQEFFHSHFSRDDVEYTCDVTKPFMEKYTANISGNPLGNALEVSQMYRPAGKKNPIIPGSSIKGAIRTALLNDKIDLLDKTENQKNIKDVEKKLFGFKNEKDDPLRALVISDAVFESKGSSFVGVVKNVAPNKYSGNLEAKKMQMIAEMIFGSLLGVQNTSTANFLLDIDLQNSLVASDNPRKNFTMQTKFDIKDIIDSCNNFFANAFDDEYEKFFTKCVEKTDVIIHLRKQIDEIYESKNSFPLRLGHWSQVEFVTLDRARSPSKRGKIQKYGTTRTLLDYNNNFVPMGWCKCTVLD